jgi:hypothetical protein
MILKSHRNILGVAISKLLPGIVSINSQMARPDPIISTETPNQQSRPDLALPDGQITRPDPIHIRDGQIQDLTLLIV